MKQSSSEFKLLLKLDPSEAKVIISNPSKQQIPLSPSQSNEESQLEEDEMENEEDDEEEKCGSSQDCNNSDGVNI